jgi:hypothetical protein
MMGDRWRDWRLGWIVAGVGVILVVVVGTIT